MNSSGFVPTGKIDTALKKTQKPNQNKNNNKTKNIEIWAEQDLLEGLVVILESVWLKSRAHCGLSQSVSFPG